MGRMFRWYVIPGKGHRLPKDEETGDLIAARLQEEFAKLHPSRRAGLVYYYRHIVRKGDRYVPEYVSEEEWPALLAHAEERLKVLVSCTEAEGEPG